MKKTLLLCVFTVAAIAVHGQKTPPQMNADPDSGIRLNPSVAIFRADSSLIFTAVEKEPSFPGGMQKLHEYIQKNLRYPAVARKSNIEGRVFLGFVVERDGSLSDFKIYRGISDECDAEAVRVLKAGPKWIPGMQNGHLVRVSYVVPISYKL